MTASAARQLHDQLEGRVDLVLLSATETHTLSAVQAATADIFKAVNLAGNTSHGGLLTQNEVAPRELFGGSALGLWGIRDGQGAFAVAATAVRVSAEAAGAAAAVRVRQRLESECAAAAPRRLPAPATGEDDDRSDTLCWVLARPGAEDAIMRGVRAATSA